MVNASLLLILYTLIQNKLHDLHKASGSVNIKNIHFINQDVWFLFFFNQMCSLNFAEVSTLKEIFGIATDGRSRSTLVKLQPVFTVLTKPPPTASDLSYRARGSHGQIQPSAQKEREREGRVVEGMAQHRLCQSPALKSFVLLLRVSRIIKNVTRQNMNLIRLRIDYNMVICWLITFAVHCITVCNGHILINLCVCVFSHPHS